MTTTLLTELYGLAKVLQQELDRVSKCISLARPSVEEVYAYNPCAPLGSTEISPAVAEDVEPLPVIKIADLSTKPQATPPSPALGFGRIEYR